VVSEAAEGRGMRTRGHRADSLGAFLQEHTEVYPWPTYVDEALKPGSNLNYSETVPFGPSSDLKRSSTLS
jgi:hypothetical protein